MAEVQQSTVDAVRELVGAPSEKAGLITTICQLAMGDFMDMCHRVDVPAAADHIIIKMSVVRYNRIGMEGLNSQSVSGVSESLVDGYPSDIISALQRWKKGRFV